MTVDNCIKLLEAYKKQAENPVDNSRRPLTGSERANVVAQSELNYKNMKEHILKSRKFRDHPIVQELQKEDQPKQEKKKDGKKSKR